MVLEKWIGGKIRQLLGHYVEIDSEALKVAVWNGELVLNNLRLIPGPIPGTPVSVVEGSLARLELHVPWQHLKSRPVVIKVEGLEVVYGPRGASTPAGGTPHNREQFRFRSDPSVFGDCEKCGVQQL